MAAANRSLPTTSIPSRRLTKDESVAVCEEVRKVVELGHKLPDVTGVTIGGRHPTSFNSVEGSVRTVKSAILQET